MSEKGGGTASENGKLKEKGSVWETLDERPTDSVKWEGFSAAPTALGPDLPWSCLLLDGPAGGPGEPLSRVIRVGIQDPRDFACCCQFVWFKTRTDKSRLPLPCRKRRAFHTGVGERSEVLCGFSK